MIRSIASTPMTVIAKQLTDYMQTAGAQARPEAHALQFYLLEHASGMVRAKYSPHHILPEGELKIMETYNEQSLKMAARAYYYLLLICWREMRYCGSNTRDAVFKAAGVHAGADGEQMRQFMLSCSEKGALECAKSWEKAGPITIGQLTKALVFAYRKGKWGSSYGGPKWAVVTECLDSFVWGKTSAAMMLDTVWTLAHNTAPIFNKSVGLYSGQDASTLLEILDVQRAGMIPQYILTATTRGYRGAQYIPLPFQVSVKSMGNVLGGVFADKSDVHWPTVKALGGKGQYSEYVSKLGQKEAPAADVLTAKALLDAKKKFMAEPMKTAPFSGPLVKKLVPGVTVSIGRVL